MSVNENITTGRKYRVLVDEASKLWQRISFWHKASDCEFDDGQNAEEKLGAIKGITTDLSVTETGYAADMSVVSEINSNLESQKIIVVDSENPYITGDATNIFTVNYPPGCTKDNTCVLSIFLGSIDKTIWYQHPLTVAAATDANERAEMKSNGLVITSKTLRYCKYHRVAFYKFK